MGNAQLEAPSIMYHGEASAALSQAPDMGVFQPCSGGRQAWHRDPSGSLPLDTERVWDAEREGTPFRKGCACPLKSQGDLPDLRYVIYQMGAKKPPIPESIVG